MNLIWKNTNTFESFHKAASMEIICLFGNRSQLTVHALRALLSLSFSQREKGSRIISTKVHPKGDYGERRSSQRKKTFRCEEQYNFNMF